MPTQATTTRFSNPMQERVYRTLLQNPPTTRGCTLSSAFIAGASGTRGVNYGVPTSLQRAAWTAGRDHARRKGF